MSLALRYTSTQLKSTSLLSKAIASFQENLASFWNYGNQNQENRMTAPVYTFSPIHMNISSSIYNMDTSIPQDALVMNNEDSSDAPFDLSTWLISTLKRRKKKMNKHKLKKRRKLLRLKSKK